MGELLHDSDDRFCCASHLLSTSTGKKEIMRTRLLSARSHL